MHDYPLLEERYGDRLLFNEELKNHTTIRTGGKADLFFECKSKDDLAGIIPLLRKYLLRYILIGCGSNIIASDEGYRGVVIKNCFTGEIEVKENIITASSGVPLWDIVKKSVDCSLAGIEFLAGIPGTLGGAIYMNAGAFGWEIKDILKCATVLKKDGTIREVKPSYFHFGYRRSTLKRTGETVLEACLKLEKGKKAEIALKIQEILELRKTKHPDKNLPSAGCIFKNIPEKNGKNKLSAGFLLEKAGAKKEHVGGASVFPKHANIIVNKNNASARDIMELAEKLRMKVWDKFNIELKREVRYLNAERGFE